MNEVVVNIVPKTWDRLPLKVGNFKSSLTKMIFNKVTNEGKEWYTVLLNDEDLMRLKTDNFIHTLADLLTKNIDGDIGVKLYYHFDQNSFEPTAGVNVLELDEGLRHMDIERITYIPINANIQFIHDMLSDIYDEEDEFYDYDDDEEDDLDDPFEILKFYSNKPIMEKKKKSTSKNESRTYRDAKNPKKNVKKYGIIIADDKSDLRRDEKEIRKFLKGFIPGDAEWKRDYREKVARRWIKSYAITKKKLKENEKNFQKQMKRIKNHKSIKSGYLNSWNDPTR